LTAISGRSFIWMKVHLLKIKFKSEMPKGAFHKYVGCPFDVSEIMRIYTTFVDSSEKLILRLLYDEDIDH
jgi:hypothetical protein